MTMFASKYFSRVCNSHAKKPRLGQCSNNVSRNNKESIFHFLFPINTKKHLGCLVDAGPSLFASFQADYVLSSLTFQALVFTISLAIENQSRLANVRLCSEKHNGLYINNNTLCRETQDTS